MVKPVKISIKSLATSLFTLFSSALASSGAHAQFFWDVEANAGTFAPVALGEDISLDACGSRLFVVGFSEFGTSLCNVTNQSLFSVNWFATNVDTGAFSWLTGGLTEAVNDNLASVPTGSAAANLQTTTSTGAGSFFNSVGTYAIGLYVSGTNNASLTESISNGGTPFNFNANFGPDFGNTLTQATNQNGTLNNGANLSAGFAITAPPVTVPEPMQLLMLIPALFLVARRETRRRMRPKVHL